MFLGRESLGSARALDEVTMERRARETLKTLSVTTIRSVRQIVAGLSGGQRQSVAVAKAVMWNSRVVILDEPTAALGVAQTRQVLDLVKRLGEQGLAVVLVSHNLHDIFEVADRITVLRLGQNVAEFEAKATNQQEIVQAITAGQLDRVPGQAGGGRHMSTVAEQPAASPPRRAQGRRPARVARGVCPRAGSATSAPGSSGACRSWSGSSSSPSTSRPATTTSSPRATSST